MRVGLFVVLAMLFAGSAQAKPLHLLDDSLMPPGVGLPPAETQSAPPASATVQINTAPDPTARLVGWSFAEGLASIGTNVAFVLAMLPVAGAIVSTQVRSGSVVAVYGILLLGSYGLSVLAPFLTSLVVWGIDRNVPGNASYGRILLFSVLARVLTLGISLGLAFLMPDQGGTLAAVVGLFASPVVGAAAEVLAARTAPAPTRVAMIGVPVFQTAF